ncbi:HDOD domain-containing protein, partial [Methylicorpusculum sp.]
MDAALLKILARIDTHQLPAIPKVLLSLIEAFQNQQTSFDDLTRIIAQDAGLSSKVLAAANSSFYQQFGELKNLNRVVVVLGLETLKTITMTSATQQFFGQIPPSQQNFLEVIWFRSLACAHFARRLAKLTGFVSPDQAYLTGLLHRLGQLVLLQCFPKEYSALLSEHSEDVIEVLEKK